MEIYILVYVCVYVQSEKLIVGLSNERKNARFFF